MGYLNTCRKILLFLVTGSAIVQLNYASDVVVTSIKIDIGGGECVDAEDCNNNGICRFTEERREKGTCNCLVNFSGPHCGVPTKDSIGQAVPDADSNANNKNTRGKHSNMQEVATGIKRKLDYDTSSNIFGLSPLALAEAEQPFLIYNPDKRVYCFVSHDLKVVGSHDPYVEARPDRLGARNVFKFVKIPGTEGKFYIHNIDQNKYIFVSNKQSESIKDRDNNVFASAQIPVEAEEKNQFIFEFEDEDGDGLFRIMNQGKVLYISNNLLGMPLYRMAKAATHIEAENLRAQFFQFAIKDKATQVVFKIHENEKQGNDSLTVIDSQQGAKICYKGRVGDWEQEANVDYKEVYWESRAFTKSNGFIFNGELKATLGAKTFMYRNTQLIADTETVSTTMKRTATIKVKPNYCACVMITFNNVPFTHPYELEATLQDKKTLKAKGEIKGVRNFEFVAHAEMYRYWQGFKCRHEK